MSVVAVLAVVVFLLAVALAYMLGVSAGARRAVEAEAAAEAKRLFDEWRRREHRRAAEERAKALLEEWRAMAEEEIRRDALKRSASVVKGRVAEQLAPMMLAVEEGLDPRDMRFIGSPVDYVVFRGLSSTGRVEEIVFVEVKTGASRLSRRERSVKDAVEAKRCRWLEYRLGGGSMEEPGPRSG